MTTTAQLPAARPFTPEECAVLVAVGIIAEGEQAAVLAGKRLFTVDDCLAMLEAGVLYEDDRIELLDGVLLIMPPIGDDHEYTTDWLTELCGGGGRAIAGRTTRKIFSWSSRSPTLHCATTAAPSWHGMPRPASSRSGSSICTTRK